MAVLKKANSILTRFKHDESGIAAISWAVSLTAIIGAMGAAMDFAMLSAADARSQTIADTTALAAAIYVKNHEAIPQDRTKGLIGEYTAQELGYDYRNWVIDGAEGVTVNVSYDNVNREATVTVGGQTRPTLMQILGFETLGFNAQTVVKYYEKELLDPASIVMVLDNSGSMDFDDMPLDSDGNRAAAAQPRIDGLENGAKTLMTMLDDVVGPQDGSSGEPRVLRTGMMAFASDIIPARTINMKWGTLSDSNIDAMTPGGATNSAPPLTIANTWLNTNEPPVHAAESPGKTPLKYIILMTDGKNTVGDEEWVAREGTQNWRAWLPTHTTTTEIQSVEVTVTVPATEGGTSRQVVNAYVPDGNCAWEWGYPYQRYTYRYSHGYTRTWYSTSRRVVCDVTTEGTDAYETTEWQDQEVEVTTTTWDWEYREQEDMPTEAGDWEEGEFDIESNILTRAECDLLNAPGSGVEIFSIAFALDSGHYRTNQWGINNGYGADYTYETTDEDANKARAILQYCASDPDNFITANDSGALEAAFTRIGNDIIQEIIRISS